MNRISILVRLFLLCSFVGLCSTQEFSQTRRLHRRNSGAPSNSVAPSNEESQKKNVQTKLRLTNGTSIVVDDAWETAQGIWYKQGGMSHLAPRDRVKAIERGSEPESKVQAETLKPLLATPAQAGVFDK